jgi:hypothetical protein
MIIAGWLLALLGLAQVVYAVTLDVVQLVPGNRLLGVAPSLVANADLLAQRTMVHQSGLACFLAGAVFLAAAYLKPAPEGVRSRAWTSMAAIAAAALSIAALVGFGVFLYDLKGAGVGKRLTDEAQLKQSAAEAAARMLTPAPRGTQETVPPSGSTAAPSSEPAD